MMYLLGSIIAVILTFYVFRILNKDGVLNIREHYPLFIVSVLFSVVGSWFWVVGVLFVIGLYMFKEKIYEIIEK